MHTYFFALFPDVAVRDRIAEAAAVVKRQLGLRGRLVAATRLHLTLHFVGRFESPQPEVEARAARAGATAASVPLAFALDRAMSFRRAHGAMPCVFAASDETAHLQQLADRLAGATRGTAPAALAGHPFRPHVTWLYSADSIEGEWPMTPLVWQATSFVLAHGVSGESAYRILRTWPLVAANPPE